MAYSVERVVAEYIRRSGPESTRGALADLGVAVGMPSRLEFCLQGDRAALLVHVKVSQKLRVGNRVICDRSRIKLLIWSRGADDRLGPGVALRSPLIGNMLPAHGCATGVAGTLIDLS